MLWTLVKYSLPGIVTIFVLSSLGSAFLLFCGLPDLAALLCVSLGDSFVSAVLSENTVRVYRSLPVSARNRGQTLWGLTVANLCLPCAFTLVLYAAVDPAYLLSDMSVWQAVLLSFLLVLTLGVSVTTLGSAAVGCPIVSGVLLEDSRGRKWMRFSLFAILAVVFGTRAVAYFMNVPQSSAPSFQLPLLVLVAPVPLYYLVMGYLRPERLAMEWARLLDLRRCADSVSDFANDRTLEHDCFRARGIDLRTVWHYERHFLAFFLVFVAITPFMIRVLPSYGETCFEVICMAVLVVVMTGFSLLTERSRAVAKSLRFLRSLPFTSQTLTLRYMVIPGMAIINILPFFVVALVVSGQPIALYLALMIPTSVMISGVMGILYGHLGACVGLGLLIGLFVASVIWSFAWVMPVVLIPVAVLSVYGMISRSSRAYRPRRTLGEG